MGDDGSKSGFTVAEFVFFKRRSVEVSASKGIDTATISSKQNTWVVAPARAGGGARVAYAIDMGGGGMHPTPFSVARVAKRRGQDGQF